MAELGTFGGDAKILEALAGYTGGASQRSLLEQARLELKEAPEGAYTVGRSAVGNFDRDMTLASGTQAITGVGFRPYLVIFLGVRSGSGEITWGFDNGTTRNSMSRAVATGNFNSSTGASMRFDEAASTLYDATSLTMDADGFTVTWDKTGTKTGTATVLYLAFARG